MTQSAHPIGLRLVRVLALVALAASGIVAAFAAMAPASEAEIPPASTLPEPLQLRAEGSIVPAPERFLREERFQRGDTLYGLLGRLGIDGGQARQLLRSRALAQLRTGSTVSAEVGPDGRLFDLHYLAGRTTLVTVRHIGERMEVASVPAPLETYAVSHAGEIRSSLFAATDDADIPDSIAIQLADVFGGDIDFHRDLRKGDRFSVVYEMSYFEGRPVRAGRVLAAEFVNRGKVLRAVYFAGANGKGGFYAPDGKNLRKAFLRSPLAFSRISSGYGMRKHPFLHTWRKHKGVDYAAPIGTHVRSVGDGVIEFAGKQRGYGNVLIVRHNGRYSTLYAHLKGFAPGVRRGVRVEQGETIAYVGQTGWATGPHLHFEFRVANVARNPLAVALPAALPVPAAEMAAFSSRARPFAAQLDLLLNANVALLE